MKKMLAVAVAFAVSPAFAKGQAPKQTHHCEVDGKEVKATKKECHKQKGKWAKGAPAADAAAGK